MQNSDFATLQGVIQQMIAQSPHKAQLDAAAARCAWKAIMPNAVHKRTESIFFKQGKLFVKLNSSTLRQELRLKKEQVLTRLREHTKNKAIEEIVFI